MEERKKRVKRKKRKSTFRERKQRAISTLKSYQNADGTRKETVIEKKLREWLEEEKIPHVPEYRVEVGGKGKRFDFLVEGEGYKFVAECHGDYWHSLDYHEGRKPYSRLTKTQKDNIKNDKKKAQIAENLNLPLVVLWEREIKHAFAKCTKKIKDEIDRQLNSNDTPTLNDVDIAENKNVD